MCSSGSGLAALSGVLDAVAGEDLYALPGPVMLDRTRKLVAARNRIDAELTRTVRRAEVVQAPEADGMKTMAAWLRGHCRLSTAAANQLLRNGRAIEQLPAVAAGLADGSVTGDQAAVIAEVVKPANVTRAAAQEVDLGAIDEALATVAASRPHADLVTVVHHYLERLDQDGPEPDPTEQRMLTLIQHGDGSVGGRFELDPVGGEKLQAALESIVQANRPAGDSRTRAQRLADALVQLVDNRLSSGTLPFLRVARPHALVTIAAEDLVDPSTGRGVAQTGFSATLSAARARWVACDATVTRIVLGPDGQPLDVGRTQRTVPPHIRRAVEHRDKTCVFAACEAPSHWCDVHHLLAWSLGGETSLENSGLLCERHHTQVHHGFRVERDTAGRWHTYRPDGSEILATRPIDREPAQARVG